MLQSRFPCRADSCVNPLFTLTVLTLLLLQMLHVALRPHRPYGLSGTGLGVYCSVLLYVNRDHDFEGRVLGFTVQYCFTPTDRTDCQGRVLGFTVQYCFTPTETVRTVRDGSWGLLFSIAIRPQRPYGLSGTSLGVYCSVLLDVYRDHDFQGGHLDWALNADTSSNVTLRPQRP